MDRLGGQLYVCSFSSVLVVYAYYSLTYTHTLDPLYDMVLLSVGESFIPILVMALIPFTVPTRAYGAAYGVIEVLGEYIHTYTHTHTHTFFIRRRCSPSFPLFLF